MLLSATLTSWCTPFSTPFGTAMPITLLRSVRFHLKIQLSSYRTVCFLLKQHTVIATAEKVREISDGYATPATPAWNTNTPIKFPAMFMTFAIIEIHMVTLVLPMPRQSEAP